MPPHCDAMDGPVVKAAKQALEASDVNIILPFVSKSGEEEVMEAFEKTLKARVQGPEAREVADNFFFETAVRIHRAGEGAPFTGLKPAGLSHGAVIPIAEKAIDAGSPDELLKLMSDTIQNEISERFDKVMHLKSHAQTNVDETRHYVNAMLGLEVYANKIYECAKAGIAHHK